MPAGSDAFQPMFHALQKTALGMQHNTITAAGLAARLYVSTQFIRTVSINEPNDNFLRPCHWVLWSVMSETGLLVSPEEADALIPILRYTFVRGTSCHLIVYSTPITRQMLQFNNFNYYAIPALPINFKAPNWLKVELGIFAGRLYFEWDEYEEIMSYLGVQVASRDGNDGAQAERKEAFATKPLAFLHEWLAIRRKGQDFEHTPMGFITTGKPLSADHPFFSTDSNDANNEVRLQSTAGEIVHLEDDEEESDDDDDHAKEHLFKANEDDGQGGDEGEVFHDAEEEAHVNVENTFFDLGAYAQDENKSSESMI
jgi:hypothetical protein